MLASLASARLPHCALSLPFIELLMGTHTNICRLELDLYMIQGLPLVGSLSRTGTAAEVSHEALQ